MASAPNDRPNPPDAELSPDEVEQRQRPDGSLEEEPVDETAAEPLSPDEIEQRQAPDGTIEGHTTILDPSDEPLSPDEIEQRQSVGDDDEEEWAG